MRSVSPRYTQPVISEPGMNSGGSAAANYSNDDHNRNQALGITLRTVFQRCLVFGSCILYAANLTNRAVLVARDHTNQHQRAVIPTACQHAYSYQLPSARFRQ